MNEPHVIKKVLNGDIEAYSDLVNKYAALLVGAARHLIQNADDAEDLAQETLLDAYRNLSTLQNHNAYRGWVFGILRYKCIDYLRRRKPESLNLDEYADVISAPAQKSTGDLMEALNTLPLQDREILAARYIQDLDYKDIAATLGISEEAARMRCSRARSRLRNLPENQMRHAMGAFIAFPLADGFTSQIMKNARQIQTAPSTAVPTGSLFSTGILLQKAIWPAVISIGFVVLSFGLFRVINSHSSTSVSKLNNQSNIEAVSRRSGQVEPKIVTKDEMILVGITEDRSDICALWTKFSKQEKAIKNKIDGVGYELHRFLKDKIEVTVGFAVTKVDAVPEGMTVIHVPAGQYAIFTHRLVNGGYEGLNPVIDEWLKTGPYKMSDNFIIELYDERFKGGDQPDSEIDFLIPVKPKA